MVVAARLSELYDDLRNTVIGEGTHPILEGHRVRKGFLSGAGILILASALWFLMNANFQPRFSLEPYRPTSWMIVSLVSSVSFGLALSAIPRTRSFALVPFFFSIFPAAFLIDAALAPAIRAAVPPSAAAGGADWKFVSDLVFFSAELLLGLPFLRLAGVGNPFAAMRPRSRRPLGPAVGLVEFLFAGTVLVLLVLFLLAHRFPPGRFLSLLGYQILFAALLGLKEELFFRWILVRVAERALASRGAAILWTALLWSVYHGLFGEGIGSGFVSAFWVFVVSLWWSFLSYWRGNIRGAWFGHFLVELYGFYLMYYPLVLR